MNNRLAMLFVLLASISVVAQSQASHAGSVQFQNPPDVATPTGYSHSAIVTGGKMIFVAGQVGLDKKGQMVSKDDFRAQALQAFTNMKAVLAAAGATPANILKLNYYVVGLNRERLTALREVRDQFIDKAHPPASTLAGVQALFREDCLVEIEAVAVVPQ